MKITRASTIHFFKEELKVLFENKISDQQRH